MDNKDYNIEQSLNEISKLRGYDASNLQIVKIDKFAGEFMDYPQNLSEEVKTVYKNKGIHKLFSHQANAIQHVLDGKHVVVATPTASGKTLIYNTVTLDVFRDRQIIFPIKVLGTGRWFLFFFPFQSSPDTCVKSAKTGILKIVFFTATMKSSMR